MTRQMQENLSLDILYIMPPFDLAGLQTPLFSDSEELLEKGNVSVDGIYSRSGIATSIASLNHLNNGFKEGRISSIGNLWIYGEKTDSTYVAALSKFANTVIERLPVQKVGLYIPFHFSIGEDGKLFQPFLRALFKHSSGKFQFKETFDPGLMLNHGIFPKRKTWSNSDAIDLIPYIGTSGRDRELYVNAKYPTVEDFVNGEVPKFMRGTLYSERLSFDEFFNK